MGGAASKAQETDYLNDAAAVGPVVARTKSSATQNHRHRSRRQKQQQRSSSASPPPGIPTQAQFGYLIQQIGEDPNQVQVTPGYYYASYEQSKRRHRSHDRRRNSEPVSSSHRSQHRSRDSNSKKTSQHRSSTRERRHASSRRNPEPARPGSRDKVKKVVVPERDRVSAHEAAGERAAAADDDEDAADVTAVPLGNASEDRPRSAKGASSRSTRPTSAPSPFKDAEYVKKRRENPLPKPPENVYETDKYHRLKRSQTVDSAHTSSIARETRPERSFSERRPKPRVARLPEDLVPTTKSTSFDSRIEKKLPRPPIKDRVLDKLFSKEIKGDSGDPLLSPSARKGPLSLLRSITLSGLPLKKAFLSRNESRLVNTRAADEPPPYVGPPISIPLSSPLNPASPHEVVYRKKTYPTAAHLFEAHKFLKHKPELAERLRMVTESPYEMGKLSYAFQMEGMVRDDWELVWRDKLDEVLWFKFNQHPQLCEELLATGHALLLDGNEVRHADPDTPGVNELGEGGIISITIAMRTVAAWHNGNASDYDALLRNQEIAAKKMLLNVAQAGIQKFRRIRNASLLFSMGIFISFCVAALLTFVSFAILFVVLFVVLPLCAFLGVPIQIAITVFDLVRGFVRWPALPSPSPPPVEKRKGDSLPMESQETEPTNYSPWKTPLKSALGFKDTPSPFLLGNNKPLPPVHSDTLEQIKTPLIVSLPDPIENSPNVLGLNFVESPTEYTAGDTPFPHINYLATLSDKIIDEILHYLPSFYVGILALVSRDMAARFRFRRVHSGSEYCPLSTFSEISRRPRLGDQTRRLVIHRTFYRPPIKTQWLLEGSDPIVVHTSWRSSEEKNQTLLAAVLKACRQISSLTWNETRRSLPLSILKTVELRLGTCLRHLDISANYNQLINYLNRHHDPLQTFQLNSIVIRDGFTEESLIAITGFLRFSAASIRKICFRDSNFGNLSIESRPLLYEMLRELPRLEHIDFMRPLDLDMVHIPITHIGLGQGLALTIQNPVTTYTPDSIRFEFFSPLGHVLSNLTTVILHMQNHVDTLEVDSWSQNARSEHFRTLAEVISAAVNLRVFAFNAPIPVVLGPTSSTTDLKDDAGSDPMFLSSDVLEALITKEKLVSLSLMARIMTPHQLRQICENLRTLSHLGVYMAGESIHISKYSQHFTKLARLIALDVAIRSFDQYCPCGHEMDPRLPHYEEGTAMGRLCRRFRPRVDMNGQRIPGSATNKHLKIVRLSRLGWHYDYSCDYEHDLGWLSSPSDLVSQVESMWGPCEVVVSNLSSSMSFFSSSTLPLERELSGDGGGPVYSAASGLQLELEKEAIRRIFKPLSWTEFSPDTLTEMK